MDAAVTEGILLELLERQNADWTRESGYIRFLVRRNGLCWETDCLCTSREILVYGRYPFSLKNRGAALTVCNRANLRMVRGALLLPEDGRPVCRTAAAMNDIYDASFRLREALDDNNSAIVRWWGRLEALMGPAGAQKTVSYALNATQ